MNELERKLIKDLWVSPDQFMKAEQKKGEISKSIFSSIVKLNYLNEEEIYSFFSQHSQIPLVKISDYRISGDTLGLFPEELYREHLFVPLFKIDNVLYMAMANPLDAEFINTLETRVNFNLHLLFACPSSIISAIDHFFGPDDKYFGILGDLITSPHALNLVPFWRESERIPVNIPLEFKSTDKRVGLAYSGYIGGTSLDISKNGKAMGIKTIVFIPSNTQILIKFPSQNPSYEARPLKVRLLVL